MGRRLGLVVGVNRYQDNLFQPLQFAENDARAFAQWLVNDKGGKWATANMQQVYGTNATKDCVESLILQICLSATQPDDLVLIYIASHAFLNARSEGGYLALTDTVYREPRTGLDLAPLVQQILTQSCAGHIIVMLDSFQIGQEWSARRTSPYDVRPLLGPTLLTGLQQQQHRILLCSCRGNEFSPEVGDRGLGVLMHRILVGLSGPVAAAGTGDVTLQNLYTYLKSKLEDQHRLQVFGQAPTPLLLVGEMPWMQQEAQILLSTNTPQSRATYTAGSPHATPGPVLQQVSYNATATAQLSPPPQPENTPAHLHASKLEQQRQQQSKLHLNQALQLFQVQHVEEALGLTEHALQLTPDDGTGLILKGQILATLGRFPEALTTINQLCQKEPFNALAWSMGAVLLTNMGRQQEALSAIERSLELDASNPESYVIKTNIMSSIAITQNSDKTLPKNELIASEKRRGGPTSFLVGGIFQFVGLLMGILGGLLPLLRPTLPVWLSWLLESFGLAILCVNAARGAYRHGFLRVLITLFFSFLVVAMLGISVGYHPVYRKIVFELQAHTGLLLPMLFLGAWLALAASIPVILAVIGFVSGTVTGVRRRR